MNARNPKTPDSPLSGRSFFGCSVLALVTVASLIPMAFAQTAPAASAATIELPAFTVSTSKDVGYRAGNSVSATRIDTPIKDLPFTISAFTEQFITDIGALDLQDILRFAPGVTSGDKAFAAGNNRFSIRGFDGDVPPQRNGFSGNRNVDTANVTRVEVIKGPASLLYGQIIPGGTVNYITKRPTAKQFISIKQSFGNHSDHRTVIDVNVPVTSQLGIRVVASKDQAPQWAEFQDTESTLIAPSVAVQLTPNISLIIDYEKLEKNETPPLGMMPNTQITGLNGAPSATLFPNLAARSRQQGLFDAGSINLGFLANPPIYKEFNYQSLGDYRRSDYSSMNVELNAKLGDHWVARANYSWNTREITYKFTGLAQWDVTPTALYRSATLSLFDYLNEYKANPAAVLADPTKTASVTMQRRKRVQQTSDYTNTYQVDLTGKYDLNGLKLNPLVGAYRQYGASGGGFTLSSNTVGTGTGNTPAEHFPNWNYFDPSTWDRTRDYDEFALPVSSAGGRTYSLEDAYYGILSATAMKDRLIVIGGARYDKFQSGGAAGFSYEAKKTTPQYGAGFKITKDAMVFANYSKSFLVENTTLVVENPTYNPALPLNATTNNNFARVAASPTTGLGYEFGLKTDFYEGRISSTLTLFHLERADRVVTVRQPIAGLNSSGAPSVTEVTFSKQGTVDQSEGIEFEITYSPLDNLQIYATYATMDIKTTTLTVPPLRATTDTRVSGDYASYVAGYNEAVTLLTGAVPEGSAERLASLWARYTFKDGGFKGLWVAGGGNYTSAKAQRSANPSLFFKPYYLFDAAIGYDWKNKKQSWNFSVNFKNIADEEYYPANQSRGRPRQIIASVGTKF